MGYGLEPETIAERIAGHVIAGDPGALAPGEFGIVVGQQGAVQLQQFGARLLFLVHQVRRDFHQHPELGNREVRTAGLVAVNGIEAVERVELRSRQTLLRDRYLNVDEPLPQAYERQ